MNPSTAAEVSGKKVIVRADLDLPSGTAQAETFRLERMIPTLRDLLDRGGEVRIIAHRGRPGGVADPTLSTKDFAPLLSERLGVEVSFGGNVTEPTFSGKVTLFENLRFNPGEEANSPEFVQALLRLGELYVNESFATIHDAHASIASLPKYLPHFAGLNLMSEVENLGKIMQHPARPLIVIIGGAKIETKKPLIDYMTVFADKVLIGGALINEGIAPAEKLVLPADNLEGKDIGTLTIERFKREIAAAKTIVWNGPMGIFEEAEYSSGTKAIAQAVAASSAFTVVGGGDTIAALAELGLLERIGFVSTGGGAMLELLSGKAIPGLEALG